MFLNKYGLAKHVECLHITDEHICSHCGEKFHLKIKLKNHTATVHGRQTGEVKIDCTQCEKVEIICFHCGKMFLDENRLARHVEFWHETGEHICVECGEKFILKGKLKNHTATKHGKQAVWRWLVPSVIKCF